MTIDQFIKLYTGSYCNFDGYHGSQCMDLIHFYKVMVLGIPLRSYLSAPTAYQSFKNFKVDKYLKKILNTPTGVPKKGDIIYWDTTVGDAGHVAIFLEGDVNSFTSFDCNWPVGSLPKKVKHDYKGVVGWLRPDWEFVATVPEKELSDMRDSRDKWKKEVNNSKEINKLLENQLSVLRLSQEQELEERVKNLSMFYDQRLKALETQLQDQKEAKTAVEYVAKPLSDYSTKELVENLLGRLKG